MLLETAASPGISTEGLAGGRGVAVLFFRKTQHLPAGLPFPTHSASPLGGLSRDGQPKPSPRTQQLGVLLASCPAVMPTRSLRTPKAERKGSSRVLLGSATVGPSSPALAKDRAAEGPTRLVSWLASSSTGATQWDVLAKAALQHHRGFQPVSKRLT